MAATPRTHIFSSSLLIFSAVCPFLGFGLGVFLRDVWSLKNYVKMYYLLFPGRIAMNLLELLIYPVIISCPVNIITSVRKPFLGRLGIVSCVLYVLTTIVVMDMGIIMICTVFQGDIETTKSKYRYHKQVNQYDFLLKIISYFFPDNFIKAAYETVSTQIAKKECDTQRNVTDQSCNILSKFSTETEFHGTSVLALATFSIILGCVINFLGKDGYPLKALFRCTDSVIFFLIEITTWFIPFATISLVAHHMFIVKDVMTTLRHLGVFVSVILGGYFIYSFLVLPLIYIICTRSNPLRLACNVCRGLFTAWITTSSSLALLVVQEELINNCRMDTNFVTLVLSLGSQVNKNGTSLYVAVACIFIKVENMHPLFLSDIVVIGSSPLMPIMNNVFHSMASLVSAFTSSELPQSGVMTLVIVMTAAELPIEEVSTVLLAHWFLDHFKSATNVWADCVAAGIMSHFFEHTKFPEVKVSTIPLTQSLSPIDITESSMTIASEK